MSETEEARLECYTEAIADAESESVIPTFEELASAAIAVADEEQAALRAEVERLRTEMRQHLDGGQLLLDRAQDASKRLLAEVERLTRECLDREATETDARERLRQVEATLTLDATHHVRRVWIERRGEVSWSCACGHVMKHQQMKDGYALIPMCPDDPRAAQAHAETFRD